MYNCATEFEHSTRLHKLALYIKGITYIKLNSIDKAEETAEELKKLINQSAVKKHNGRLFYGDIYAKSFYMLGKIYQQKGWKGKAIENYEKFLFCCSYLLKSPHQYFSSFQPHN